MQVYSSKIPQEVLQIMQILHDAGYEIYIVGGCVRDIIMNKTPNDWDMTTNAHPEQIQSLFEEDETFYENSFGTVGIKVQKITQLIDRKDQEDVSRDTQTNRSSNEDTVFVDDDGIIEITPYRTEGSYSNARHPDEVHFSEHIEDDLKRRDFTINAIAYNPFTGKLVDLYNGKDDINNKIIRTVGDPNKRFGEDALRMMRALRFSSQLNFTIDGDTMTAIANNSTLLEKVSRERVRDEFIKIITSDGPMMALGFAQKLNILQYIVPELEEGVGCEQGKKAHKYDVFEHLMHSLQHAANKDLTLAERLAALLHDIGKPRSRRKKGSGYTFYGHEVIGARMVREIMKNLHFSKDTSEAVEKLVRWHMFFSDPDQISLSAVRRMIVNVGKDRIQYLLNIRMCDRIGSGRPKEQPFRLRKYTAMVDEAMRDPISVNMLKVDGNMLINELHEKPGPRIGWILHALLEDVLDDTAKNTKEYLINKAKDLIKLNNAKLQQLGKSGAEKRMEVDEVEIAKLHAKHKI